jgi:hypothetical protein
MVLIMSFELSSVAPLMIKARAVTHRNLYHRLDVKLVLQILYRKVVVLQLTASCEHLPHRKQTSFKSVRQTNIHCSALLLLK